MNKQYIVAIEIGSSKAVGAIAELTANGQLKLLGIESEPTINYVRYGCIQNVESTKTCINRIIFKLNQIVDGDIKSVYVGVSGKSLHSVPTESQCSLSSEQAITQALLDRIKSDATRNGLNNYDTVDVIPRSYAIDRRENPNPVGSFGTNIVARLNLIVARPNIKTNLRRVFNQQVQIKDFITTAVAVADAVLSNDERKLGCMLVDMGAETTTVSIYRDNALVYIHTIPLGGRNLTRDITTLGILEETAEKIKRNIAFPLVPQADVVTIDNVRSSDASNYILARTGEIIANINSQVNYAGLLLSDIHYIVLVGGGAMLKGIDKKIDESFNITNDRKVRIFNQVPQGFVDSISVTNPTENTGVMALLLEAAKRIGTDSCVLQRTYVPTPQPIYDTDNEDNINNEEEEEEKNKNQKKQHNTSFLQDLKNKIVNLMNENDEGADSFY
ncbi:MAG: cell division protein FtsA [Muribaculaceae bacterium]